MTPPKPPAKLSSTTRAGTAIELPFSDSVGYQVRMTHRALQRLLQARIEPHGITLGMWYFLRALWNEDGLTQRELSRLTGTTEPTALIAIQSMEKRGLVRRMRGHGDRRKWHVHLTAKGQRLKATLIPLAREVVQTARRGLSSGEMTQLLKLLDEIQKNVHAAVVAVEDPGLDIVPAKPARASVPKS